MGFGTAIYQTQLFSRVKIKVMPAGFGKKTERDAEETVCVFLEARINEPVRCFPFQSPRKILNVS